MTTYKSSGAKDNRSLYLNESTSLCRSIQTDASVFEDETKPPSFLVTSTSNPCVGCREQIKLDKSRDFLLVFILSIFLIPQSQ
jgi:hypothetical protein